MPRPELPPSLHLHLLRPSSQPLTACLLALVALAAPAPAQGSDWTVVDVPLEPEWKRAVFYDVVPLPDGSAWAVGNASRHTPDGSEAITLAMHWDGQTWTNTPTPYVAPFPGGASDALYAVDAIAPDDVWAAGYRYGDAAGLNVGAWLHVIHWDGSSWSEAPVPPPPGGTSIHYSGLRVQDIAAIDSDDVWFSGVWAEPNQLASVTWRPLLMHWDGSGMTVFPTPDIAAGQIKLAAYQLSVIASDDIWAVCRGHNASGATLEPTVLHWDGSSWSHVPAPSLGGLVVMEDVVAVGPDDVWFFGHTSSPEVPFALHWTGGGFQLVQGAPFVATATAVAPDELYGGSGAIHEIVGGLSVDVETFPSVPGPSFLGSEVAPGCSVWAVGRWWDPQIGEQWPLAVVKPLSAGCTPLEELLCVGDGTGGACPCGNTSPVGQDAGCAHSFGGAGTLRTTGTASVSGDTLQLVGGGMPDSSALYFQGTASVDPVSFGDGLRCVGGTITRLGTQPNAGGASSYPAAGDAPVSVQGSVPAAGGSRAYQVWYRNVAAFCTPSGFNLTNAVRVVWAP